MGRVSLVTNASSWVIAKQKDLGWYWGVSKRLFHVPPILFLYTFTREMVVFEAPPSRMLCTHSCKCCLPTRASNFWPLHHWMLGDVRLWARLVRLVRLLGHTPLGAARPYMRCSRAPSSPIQILHRQYCKPFRPSERQSLRTMRYLHAPRRN